MVDPYFFWAVGTDFADLPLNKENEVPILIEGPEDAERTRQMIKKLRDAGVRVPLDADGCGSKYFTAYERLGNDALAKTRTIASEYEARWELSLPFASP
ncbi:hypothetical protein C7T35_36345 [Variovorax sp. WS11]|nr:hypothetical protein C7T35_36345 [Variovorax sp. WS11]